MVTSEKSLHETNIPPWCPASHTHVMKPDQLVRRRVCPDVALKVDIIASPQVVRVQGGAQLEGHPGCVCKVFYAVFQNIKIECISLMSMETPKKAKHDIRESPFITSAKEVRWWVSIF